MVGTSKILTVSYGTFSCTLEGFDDSFSTMKAIAEYFRGLASDDRYFGAEPPTPDAEMLAQIAERETSRRVDARMDDGGIVLRAAALTDQSDAANDTTEDDAKQVHDKESRAEVETARKAEKAARKAKKAKAKAEAKAAKQAAKAAKAEAGAIAQAEADAETEADETDQTLADAGSETEATADDTTDASQPDDAALSELPILSSVSAATAAAPEGATGSDVEETRETAPSSMLAAKDPAPTPLTEKAFNEDVDAAAPLPAHPDKDSIAAKLQRIRAVVGTSEADSDTISDDLSDQFLPQAETPDVADFDRPSDPQSDDTSNDITDPVAEFDAHEAELDDAFSLIDEPSADDDDAKSSLDMISRVMSRRAKPQVDAAEPDVEPELETETGSKTDVSAPPSLATPPPVRVIRMKRADFEKAVEDGQLEDADPAPAPNTGPDLGLLDGADDLDDYFEDSDFDDSDLVGEDDSNFADDLAAINADFEDASPDDIPADMPSNEDESDEVDEDNGASAPSDQIAGTDVHPDETQVDDAALDRLMSETDVKMREPEGSRRRDAIAQLKAAVAAKEAARQVGDTDDDSQDVENAFRNDLSEAVRPEADADAGNSMRPRPVVVSGSRTERPRPAPLKLVAAQRVDLQSAEKRSSPVVPRRVAARHEATGTPAAGSFAEFAESMGASELPDLLEAAAAYTAFVEGADEFSRPQILRRVRAVASDDFKREDGLRSFADLLRAGRFTKVRNGRFQVADDSRYNPERRAG